MALDRRRLQCAALRLPAPLLPLPEPLILAWLAGFTDGEGYMDLDTTARLVWTTTHRPTLEMIQGKVGGKLRLLQKVEGSRKPRYQLSVYAGTARRLLVALTPHLIEKRAQAELILSYVPSPRGRTRSPEILGQRAIIKAKLKELRHVPS